MPNYSPQEADKEVLTIELPFFVPMFGSTGWLSGLACGIPHQSAELYKRTKARLWNEAIVLQKGRWIISQIFQKY